jgi:IS1 family transposase
MVSMNRLGSETRAQVIRCLVDGNSIRATVRITGVAKNTVIKLLVEAGAICSEYQDRVFRNLGCRRIQVDEIWSFVGAKDKNVPEEKRDQFGIGSVWTWTAIDAESKLIPTWQVGTRDAGVASEFLYDLSQRLAKRVQLTSDGHKAYLEAVDYAFSGNVDYAMLVKLYGADPSEEKRYSPAQCIGTRCTPIVGNPDPKHISTCYVETQNLTMRMSMRRFTRLTNAFSKKLENHIAALGLYFMYYNFARIHQTLRVSPAMAAGVTGKLWSVYDIVALIEAKESEAKVAKTSN